MLLLWGNVYILHFPVKFHFYKYYAHTVITGHTIFAIHPIAWAKQSSTAWIHISWVAPGNTEYLH